MIEQIRVYLKDFIKTAEKSTSFDSDAASVVIFDNIVQVIDRVPEDLSDITLETTHFLKEMIFRLLKQFESVEHSSVKLLNA